MSFHSAMLTPNHMYVFSQCYVDPKPHLKQSDDGRVFCSHQSLGKTMNIAKILTKFCLQLYAHIQKSPNKFASHKETNIKI